MSINNNTADVIIIGGGIMGTSTAYYLARSGFSVLLLERKDVASGAGGATDSFLTYNTKQAGIILDMALESGKIYEGLSEELETDIELKNCGSIQLIEREEEWGIMETVKKQQVEQTGLELHMLSIDEVRKIEPVLSPELLGGLYCPSSGKVNPFQVLFGYARAARRLGARIKTGAEVTDIIVDGGRVKGVKIQDGTTFYAETVINCSGVQSPKIGEMLGIDIPIIPRRGQIVITEPIAPVIHTVMMCARVYAIKIDPSAGSYLSPKVLKMGTNIGIEQSVDGSILLGSTSELGYEKNVTTLDAIEAITARAVKFMPLLGNYRTIRTFAGLRPHTPDGKPILGKVDQIDGFLMAAGHDGDGITLGPLTGLLMSELVSAGETKTFPIDALNLRRFNKDAS